MFKWFHSPKLNDAESSIAYYGMVYIWNARTKAEREHNEAAVALATYKMQKEALEKGLAIQHRTMLVAVIAVIVAALTATATIIISLNSHDNIAVKVVAPSTQSK